MSNKQKIESEKDFYNVKKAGEKLIWRFSPNEKGEFKAFKPNDNDFKALKSILGMINRVEKNNVSNNQLFAKLFISHLVGEIRQNETTVFNDLIVKDLMHHLNKPLHIFYKAFYDDLASNQLNRLTKGVFTDKQGNDVVMDYQRFKETFTPQIVEGKLDEMINNALLNLN